VTVALFDGESGTIAVGHVGDSRAYRIRDGRLEQLTADHSLVAELVRSGRLTPEQAADHPHRSVITRALGTEASVDVDTFTMETAPGDLYLLCSDGLTTMVRDEEILSLSDGAEGDPASLARALVDAANRAGGEDNITVVVFEVQEGDEEPETIAEPAEAVVESPTVPVRRRGAGKGGRLLALLGLLVVLVAAAYLVWRSVR
jgi:PPM family protein phosphatase